MQLSEGMINENHQKMNNNFFASHMQKLTAFLDWNVPQSWSILRQSFQTLRADFLLNIARRALNQPPKLPQSCVDYDCDT